MRSCLASLTLAYKRGGRAAAATLASALLIADLLSSMSDEARLKDKLRAIEALFAGATTPGERGAAGAARRRVIQRIAQVAAETPPRRHETTRAATETQPQRIPEQAVAGQTEPRDQEDSERAQLHRQCEDVGRRCAQLGELMAQLEGVEADSEVGYALWAVAYDRLVGALNELEDSLCVRLSRGVDEAEYQRVLEQARRVVGGLPPMEQARAAARDLRRSSPKLYGQLVEAIELDLAEGD